MSSNLKNVIETRVAAAARNAQRAAVRLVDADSDDLRAQLDMEESLDELAKYAFARRELAEVAELYEPYGARSKHDLLKDMLRARRNDRVAGNRLTYTTRRAPGAKAARRLSSEISAPGASSPRSQGG